MQMLQQIFGADGARYVAWLFTGLALLFVALLLWFLLRKALGDRINMSERADRRGRPPRLGVTETFSIGPQGRRLVMVRRDNVEHLIMIGGPNDVVIETNVVRGERPSVPRPEVRTVEPDPLPLPDPLPAARSAPVPAAVELKPLPVAPRMEDVVPSAPPLRAPEPPTPAKAPDPVPVARAPERAPAPPAPEPAAPPPVAEPPKPAMGFAERIRAGFGRGSVSKPAESPPEAPKAEAAIAAVEAPKMEPAMVAPPRVEPPKAPAVPSAAEMKARLEEAVQAKLQTARQPVPPPPPAAPVPPPPPVAPAPVAPPAAPAPVAPAAPAVAPPVAAPPPVARPATANPATASSAPASKNPFDSLEEEMARLLGRAPDGKS